MLFFESGYNWNHAVLEIEVPEVSRESGSEVEFVSATNSATNSTNQDRVVQRLFTGNAPPPNPKFSDYSLL